VEVPLSAATYKAATVLAVTELSRSTPFIAALGQDSRFMYPHLRQENADDDLSVNFFRQTGSRTITGTVARSLTATIDKGPARSDPVGGEQPARAAGRGRSTDRGELMAAKVKVIVSDNVTITDSDGTVHGAGDVLDIENDDTLVQWLSAGTVTKKAPAKKAEARKKR
jgi:hypothetical protein